MSSLTIDMILCGIAYVLLVYFIVTMSRPPFGKGRNRGDDGDGGVEDSSPPKIDLPPGVIWPTDGPKTKKPGPPMEV
ncbi:hypothetical protein [Echinicola shivajiensis]|uniref:hypothetical protein n=1 Tax=Echinicola shivajiensis TaxID=1035916 RepID=UPI001BFC8DE2|nr:hypothetical protein [Echinicola shivajiensis]